jgi:cysteinyl-tRNA synthetase
MTLRVSNTLTGRREEFTADDGEVLLYVCGLTTSDPAHLGHARLWAHADIVHRWLEFRGYDVRHVENFTDVNEKIVARVGEVADDEESVARHYIEEYLRQMRALNLKRATVYPRVSESVPAIVALIERLLERGYAYEADGSVYFDTAAFERYGELSNQSPDELEPQGPESERSEKRDPADFALWKAGGLSPAEVAEHRHDGAAPPEVAADRALTFEAPWGEGRPGWHIECSAMATTHLGDTVDIHMGGQDLVFPHHENEIAQSEAATGSRFARYWLHVRLMESGEDSEKMSSSLGNYWTVADAIEELGAGVVRTFLLSTAYDSRQTYSEDAVEEARKRHERLQRAYDRTVRAVDSPDAYATVADEGLREAIADAREAFVAAMDDDFNTRRALAALVEVGRAANSHLESRERYDYAGLRSAVEAFEELGGAVLGLRFGGEDGESETGREGDVRLGDLVELVLDIREQEREAGNYDRADALRDALRDAGVEVQDTDDGPTYRL